MRNQKSQTNTFFVTKPMLSNRADLIQRASMHYPRGSLEENRRNEKTFHKNTSIHYPRGVLAQGGCTCQLQIATRQAALPKRKKRLVSVAERGGTLDLLETSTLLAVGAEEVEAEDDDEADHDKVRTVARVSGETLSTNIRKHVRNG